MPYELRKKIKVCRKNIAACKVLVENREDTVDCMDDIAVDSFLVEYISCCREIIEAAEGGRY